MMCESRCGRSSGCRHRNEVIASSRAVTVDENAPHVCRADLMTRPLAAATGASATVTVTAAVAVAVAVALPQSPIRRRAERAG